MGVMSPFKDLGPCEVTFGATVLQENIEAEFSFEISTAEVNTSRNGTAPVDEIVIGGRAELRLQLTRFSLAELTTITPGASGTSGTSGNQMMVKSDVGTSLRDNAQQILVKPLDAGVATADTTKWLTMFKASPRPNYSWTFDVDSQRVAEVIFVAYPVTSGEVSGVPRNAMWKLGSV